MLDDRKLVARQYITTAIKMRGRSVEDVCNNIGVLMRSFRASMASDALPFRVFYAFIDELGYSLDLRDKETGEVTTAEDIFAISHKYDRRRKWRRGVLPFFGGMSAHHDRQYFTTKQADALCHVEGGPDGIVELYKDVKDRFFILHERRRGQARVRVELLTEEEALAFFLKHCTAEEAALRDKWFSAAE